MWRAAVDLFVEQGYEATTTAQIAQRAGLTRTTLFRLFPDKREILFQGQDALVGSAVEAIGQVPPGAPPVRALAAALAAMAGAHPSDRDGSRRLTALIAASPELSERAGAKRVALAAALQDALRERLGGARRAGLLADVGVRAYYDGFDTWIDADEDRPLTACVQEELDRCAHALRDVLGRRPVGAGD
nr:TetR/AcrR family transcriptional regulator [Kineococcus aurantiacus]